MADVATKCISGNANYEGRSVTRMPGTKVFTVSRKINKGMTPAQLETRYDSRFNHRAYYFDVSAT